MFKRLRTELWQPPRAHGEIQQDRTVGPLELFYDLVVAVFIGQAADHLAEHLDTRGIGEFLVVFGLVWIAWFNATLHHDLHGREDIRSRLGFAVQILLLVPLDAFIPKADSVDGVVFAIDSALLFGFITLLWWSASRGDAPQYRATAHRYLVATVAVAVVLAASAPLPAGLRMVVWGVVVLAYLLVFELLALRAPASVIRASMQITDALTERFGAFVIIVLGETTASVVLGLSTGPTDPMRLAVGLVAVLVGFGSWWTYFDFAGHRDPVDTARSKIT